jgi:hypothetical protein
MTAVICVSDRQGPVAVTGRTTDQQLRAAFLDPAMLGYFRRKLPELTEPELLARVEEALKFLFIAHECRGPIPVTGEIDDIWHYWILQTQEYARLCRLLPAGELVHHSSNDYVGPGERPVDAEANLHNDVRMLALYVENFGPFSGDRVRYWRLAAQLIEQAGWTLDELNAWLTN